MSKKQGYMNKPPKIEKEKMLHVILHHEKKTRLHAETQKIEKKGRFKINVQRMNSKQDKPIPSIPSISKSCM